MKSTGFLGNREFPVQKVGRNPDNWSKFKVAEPALDLGSVDSSVLSVSPSVCTLLPRSVRLYHSCFL